MYCRNYTGISSCVLLCPYLGESTIRGFTVRDVPVLYIQYIQYIQYILYIQYIQYMLYVLYVLYVLFVLYVWIARLSRLRVVQTINIGFISCIGSHQVLSFQKNT